MLSSVKHPSWLVIPVKFMAITDQFWPIACVEIQNRVRYRVKETWFGFSSKATETLPQCSRDLRLPLKQVRCSDATWCVRFVFRGTEALLHAFYSFTRWNSQNSLGCKINLNQLLVINKPVSSPLTADTAPGSFFFFHFNRERIELTFLFYFFNRLWKKND